MPKKESYINKQILSIPLTLSILLFFPLSCSNDSTTPSEQANRFTESIITTLNTGYTDSVFINHDGSRIYFLNSVLSVNDFLDLEGDGPIINHPLAEYLPDHTDSGGSFYWNTDLYYIEWNGTEWSEAVNLGTNINTTGNECCEWLNEDETEIIFYRENGSTGGNYTATRTSKNDPWGLPQLLPEKYGSVDQDPSGIYRHDIHKTGSGDLYLWEKLTTGNKSRLLYGKFNGISWDAPVVITVTDTASEETQVWVSQDEKTMIFNRRGADANTDLIRFSRDNIGDAWGNEFTVLITGFADGAGLRVWGEPTLSASQDFIVYIRFDTTKTPWATNIMYAPGNVTSGFKNPIILH